MSRSDSSGAQESPHGSAPAWWRGFMGQWRHWLEPRTLWARTMHNIGPKVLALVVAVTFWFVATADRRVNVEQGFDVPVTVRDTTGGRGEGTRAVSNLSPATLRVFLAGRPERLRDLQPSNIEAVVDITGLQEGSFNVPVRVVSPGGTTLKRQSVQSVQGFLDTQMVRTLPVRLSVATPSETNLPRYSVMPAEASVRGPGRLVQTVQALVSSPVVLEAGSEREVALIALDGKGQPVEGVTMVPNTVTVRRLDTGELPIKPLRVVLNDPPPNLRVTQVSIQPSTVRVVAAPELLARLREVTGRVAYREGTYTAQVRLNVPAGAQALEGVSVRLSVERVPSIP